MFAQRLKELRKSYDLTQTELAEKIGKAKSTIAGYEKGFRKPKIEDLKILAHLFNTNTDYILGLSDDKTAKEPSKDLSKLLKDTDFHYKGQRLNNDDLDFLIKYLENVSKLKSNTEINTNTTITNTTNEESCTK